MVFLGWRVMRRGVLSLPRYREHFVNNIMPLKYVRFGVFWPSVHLTDVWVYLGMAGTQNFVIGLVQISGVALEESHCSLAPSPPPHAFAQIRTVSVPMPSSTSLVVCRACWRPSFPSLRSACLERSTTSRNTHTVSVRTHHHHYYWAQSMGP